jgi:predicted Rossmann fold flavoprotein
MSASCVVIARAVASAGVARCGVSYRPPRDAKRAALALTVGRRSSRHERKFARVAAVARGGSSDVEVAVLGGGAAGLTAAYFAAKAGARVVVFERTTECGKKILMSGGSRCNVLPVAATTSDFVTESPMRGLKSVLASWSVDRCRAWLEDDVGLALGIEEVTNKYFPLSNSSREVRDKLVEACESVGVEFRCETSIDSLVKNGDDGDDGGGWTLRVRGASDARAQAVVLAMGGMSFPAVGTDGTGYAIAKRDLGHVLNEPYPALVPLVGPHPGGESMPGVSAQVELKVAGETKKKAAQANRKGFLFTHRGFSGPSILDLSHHLVRPLVRENASKGGAAKDEDFEAPATKMLVNWNGMKREEWQDRLTAPPGKALVVNRLREVLPTRLADAIVAESGVDSRCKVAELKKDNRMRLLHLLTEYEIPVKGHQGYRKAEVTGGGVKLDELNTATMESLKSPGIFMCGEVCDVFGRIGGFNFLWAWTSGRLAGVSAAKSVLAE